MAETRVAGAGAGGRGCRWVKESGALALGEDAVGALESRDSGVSRERRRLKEEKTKGMPFRG